MMDGYFVTGTDTDAGKTVASLAILEKLKAAGHSVLGLKPVASGATRTGDGLRNADALALQRHGSVCLPYAAINPVVFEAPIAPHLAALRAGTTISLDTLETALRSAA